MLFLFEYIGFLFSGNLFCGREGVVSSERGVILIGWDWLWEFLKATSPLKLPLSQPDLTSPTFLIFEFTLPASLKFGYVLRYSPLPHLG
jgi:hypothetical protein